MKKIYKKIVIWLLVIAVAVGVGIYIKEKFFKNNEFSHIASSNGRIEAVEIDIAAKPGGKVKELFVDEGDFVTTGQVVAKIDSEPLEAQLREAEAQLLQANSAIAIAESQINLKIAEKETALAVLRQREAEYEVAKKKMMRSTVLAKEGASSQQEADDDIARVKSAEAAVVAAKTQIAAAEAAIATARSQLLGAKSEYEAAKARVERIQKDLNDYTLYAPRDGRIQYIIAYPGEVVAPGGKVVNMVDLSDVYMVFFLPTKYAGRVALGTEARLILDAAPEYVIPATISYVASVAQFTPKTVETAEERQKLTFRIKAQIDKSLLQKYLPQVKTGLPGMAYVILDKSLGWPPELQTRLPDE
jgi:HlyD family secretion protein